MIRLQTPDHSHRSWWFNEAMAQEKDSARNVASGVIELDVAIVGGGYTGLWTALTLAQKQPGLRVAIIEAHDCGAGASGKNGGKAHGYWASLGKMEKDFGPDAALSIAQAGTRAQDALRAFAESCGQDVWWREGGNLKLAANPEQDAALETAVQTAQRLGAGHSVYRLDQAQVAELAPFGEFSGGLFYTEGATVHPARFARALRAAVMAKGVAVFEGTAITGVDAGSPNRLRHATGEFLAKEVVLATNVHLAGLREVAPYMTLMSSYALMTEPFAEVMERLNWSTEVGYADSRMFLHYFRKTPDGRILMGSGSGPIGMNSRPLSKRLYEDAASFARARRGMQLLMPKIGPVGVAGAWGAPIDVSSDRMPIVGTLEGKRIHFAIGFSGHGVNPSWIVAQCLASKVLKARDEWSAFAFAHRKLLPLPPEPFRFLGGSFVRWGIMKGEEMTPQKPPALARFAAKLPQLLGMRIGVR